MSNKDGNFANAAEFVTYLKAWLQQTDEATIAGSSGFKLGHARVVLCDTPCNLSGDSTRAGIEQALQLLEDEGLVWSVVANNKGKINRVAVGANTIVVPGFYLYTDAEFSEPRVICQQ